MRPAEALLLLLSVTLVLWGIIAVLTWIFRGIASLFRAPMPVLDIDEEWRRAVALVTQPMPRPDGTWERGRIAWETCEAPMQPSSLEIHDMQAPGHDARTCRVCSQRPNFSGASYRPTS